MKNIIGERLRELRGPSSQSSMAQTVDVKQQNWARWECGIVTPSAEMLLKICRAHACSADWLLGLTGKGEEEETPSGAAEESASSSSVLGERLKELRGSMSQAAFANRIGIKQTSYSAWERGVKEPGATVVAKIASAFGVSTDWLLGMSDARRSTAPRAERVPIDPRLAAMEKEIKLLHGEITGLKLALHNASDSTPTFACG